MKEQMVHNLSARKKIEVILVVVAFFLALLFFFSVGLKTVDARSVFVALSFTYVGLHLWKKYEISHGRNQSKIHHKKSPRT